MKETIPFAFLTLSVLLSAPTVVAGPPVNPDDIARGKDQDVIVGTIQKVHQNNCFTVRGKDGVTYHVHFSHHQNVYRGTKRVLLTSFRKGQPVKVTGIRKGKSEVFAAKVVAAEPNTR